MVYKGIQLLKVFLLSRIPYRLHFLFGFRYQFLQHDGFIAVGQQSGKVRFFVRCAFHGTVIRNLHQFRYGEWLEQTSGKAFCQKFLRIATARSGCHDKGDCLRIAYVGRAQKFQQFKAVYTGHIQVCQQQIVCLSTYHFHQFRRIGAGIAVYSFLGIHFFQHQEQYLVIINGYNIEISFLSTDISSHHLFRYFIGFLHRYLHRETASFPFFAIQMDFTAKHRHNIMHDGKPQTEAILRGSV